MRRSLTLSIFAGLAMLLSASPASAVERIDAYDVVIEIESSGDLLITETIAYDFGDAERRGIFRDVPTALRWEPDERYDRIYPLDVVSVSSATAPDQYAVEDAGGGKTRIRIGDPDTYITGAHTYAIAYRIDGGLNGFEDHDELYWNAIGADWSVVIDAPTVTVQAPVPIEQVACFAGPDGSSLPCDGSKVRGSTARFQHASLWPYSAFTVVAAIPPGSVEAVGPILEERPRRSVAPSASPSS
jgi:hypothetical protein